LIGSSKWRSHLRNLSVCSFLPQTVPFPAKEEEGIRAKEKEKRGRESSLALNRGEKELEGGGERKEREEDMFSIA